MPLNYPKTLLLLVILFLTGCNKTTSQQTINQLPAAQGIAIQLQVDSQHPGYVIAPDYLGLSFETNSITDSTYFNTSSAPFIQLIKNLGTGIFRIGGNSADKTFWANRSRTTAMPIDSIATSDIDRFSKFIKAIQWKVIFGLNCGGNFNPAVAASEVAYVSNSLPGMMQSFEVGNESDIYPRNGFRASSYTINDFNTEWEQYYQAIKNAVPAASFSGGAFAYNQTWLKSFVVQKSSKINLATIHFYQAGPGTDPSININTLLSQHADSSIDKFGNAIKEIATNVQLPYRVAECNSIYGGGKSDVSNTFAATLWAIDYMFRLAYTGCQGINFHGGNNGPYTPIGKANGLFFAKPEYYSMLFFKDAAKGNLLSYTLQSNGLNITAYASKTSDGTTYITIINKEPQTAIAVNLQTSGNASTVTLASLTASNLTAATGLVFAGKVIQSDGTITTTSLPAYTVNNNKFVVNVAAGSAMLVTVH